MTMPAPSPNAEPGAGASIPVEFGAWADAHGNRLFRGRGSLTIDASAGTYAFAGRRRSFLGRAGEVTFRTADICNVVVSGPDVAMDVEPGAAGRARERFPFACGSPGEAQALASVLPPRRDGQFEAGKIFHDHMCRNAGRHPWLRITNVLIAINAAAYVVMGIFGAGWISVKGMLPYVQFAANNGAATTNGEWWRLLTSMFVHYGLLHLVLNMWALYRSGPLVERLLGRASFTLVYLGSGLIGAVASIVVHGDKIWSAGASGAIFGVYGALLGYMLREKHGLPRLVTSPLIKSTLVFAGYNLVYGAVTPQIDNICHMGGLLAGVILGWLAAPPLDPRARMSAGPLRFWTAFGCGTLFLGIGIADAPHFSYIPADQQTLATAVHQTGQQEAALLKKQAGFLTAAEGGSTQAKQALSTFVAGEAVPFYNEWLTRLSSLKLRSGFQSEERRNGLAVEIKRRLACYKRLVRDLKARDSSAIDDFERDFALANAVPRS